MFDKPKRKRKQKKDKRRPLWQTMMPWFLLVIAFGMLGYAYLLETRPTPATVQTIQDRGMAESTPEFGDSTRDMAGQSSQADDAPEFGDSTRDITGQPSQAAEDAPQFPDKQADSLLRNRAAVSDTQSGYSPRLCERYPVTHCNE